MIIQIRGVWFKTSNPNFVEEYHYKLINIKHRQVLEAWLAGNSTEIEFRYGIGTKFESTWNTSSDFIENYNPELEYRLKNRFRPKSIIYDDYEEKEDGTTNIRDKQSDSVIKQSISDSPPRDNSIVTLYNSKEINNFQDYGFTGDFEGEILKEVGIHDDSIATGRYMGWIKIGNNEMFMVEWWSDGICRNYYKTLGDLKGYNLTPIKKHWYEQNFKRKLVIVDEEELMFATSYDNGCYTIRPLKDTSDYDYAIKDRVRPATKEEVMSLYVSKED